MKVRIEENTHTHDSRDNFGAKLAFCFNERGAKEAFRFLDPRTIGSQPMSVRLANKEPRAAHVSDV